MSDRVSTGIPILDRELQGGFPEGSMVVIVGDKGTGRNPLVNNFIHDGVEDGQEDLYMTLSKPPEDVRENAEYYGWDLSKDNLTFIDGYTWQMGTPSARFALKGLTDLNQISMTVINALNDMDTGPEKAVINSASNLLDYMNTQSAVQLLKVIKAKTTKNGGALVVTLGDSIHDKQTRAKVKNAADGVILLKEKNEKKFLGVDRLKQTDTPTDWKRVHLSSDKGIIIK